MDGCGNRMRAHRIHRCGEARRGRGELSRCPRATRAAVTADYVASRDLVDAFTGTGLGAPQREAQAWLKKLLNWRKGATVIHRGGTRHFGPEQDTYVFFRHDGTKKVMVALNKNTAPTALATAVVVLDYLAHVNLGPRADAEVVAMALDDVATALRALVPGDRARVQAGQGAPHGARERIAALRMVDQDAGDGRRVTLDEVREMLGGFEYWAREGLPVETVDGVRRPGGRLGGHQRLLMLSRARSHVDGTERRISASAYGAAAP